MAAESEEFKMAQEKVAQSDEYSIEDWKKIWDDYKESTPRKVTKELQDYLKKLLPPDKKEISILLPLCGQTPDLRWLYDQGHCVVGLDGVEKAVERLAETNKDLNFSRQVSKNEKVITYKSEDGRFMMVVCDVLHPSVKSLGPFDAVYDYGAYTAVQPSIRKQYVSQVFSTLKPDYRYIVEFCHDVSPECEDHPCVISFQTFKKEMGVGRNITVLSTQDVSETWGAESFFSSFALITPLKKDA